MSANLLAEVIQTIGLPEGVLNIIHGLGTTVGEALVKINILRRLVSLADRVGDQIAEVCAGSFKKVTLEMGGITRPSFLQMLPNKI